uniref:Putative metalloprotease n=1 Tax=Ixodes ricinus TaxID=34613 RepID=A0A0K8R6Z9_IXORI
MFAFTVLLILSLTGVHMAITKPDTIQETEVRLEVTMILDKPYMAHSRENYNMTRYLSAFLNAVELRFSDMTDPKINLILAEIILIDASDQAKIYYENDILRYTVHGVWTRTHSRYEFPKNRGIILIMTGFDIWNAGTLKGDMTSSAEENGACMPNKNNVALCEDDGLTFSGVGSAAQSIALLLGASFDPNKTPEHCSQDKGYLLSSNTGVSDHYNLSQCGKDEIKKSIGSSVGKRRDCFLKEPTIESSVSQVKESRELPIDFFDNTNPCNLRFGSPSCQKP